MAKQDLKIVCLGGGVGTVQLLVGLRQYSQNITVVCSMADEGGSGGRLRRLYSVPPPGDLINCLTALSDAEPTLKNLLTFRFPGNRWGKDSSIEGQKLGNLMLVALTKTTGSFEKGLAELEQIFCCHGRILPATRENVSIWAKTVEGKIVKGEEKIDRGKYNGVRALSEVHLEPARVTTPTEVKKALKEADLVITGPGDLYTTLLPVLLVPEIKKGLLQAKGKKIFVVNVANKPFETPNYKVSDYIGAIVKHCGTFLFDYVLVNKNFRPKIPQRLNYHYVQIDKIPLAKPKIIKADFVNEDYPLYHDPQKLAKAVLSVIKSFQE